MSHKQNHIILIGFKHVGKSVIGNHLAKRLHCPHIDLDKIIEMLYEKQFDEKKSCRQIMTENGEPHFRALETEALKIAIARKPSVISVGGGTPLNPENQRIIKDNTLIQITAPRGIVFERISIGGRPAFFTPGENIYESFNRLWDERSKIYSAINDFVINNDGSVDHAVNSILNKIKVEEK